MAPEPAGTGAAPGPASPSANEPAELLRMVEGLESDINALRARLAAKPDAADGTWPPWSRWVDPHLRSQSEVEGQAVGIGDLDA
jgi:hypothetical protein